MFLSRNRDENHPALKRGRPGFWFEGMERSQLGGKKQWHPPQPSTSHPGLFNRLLAFTGLGTGKVSGWGGRKVLETRRWWHWDKWLIWGKFSFKLTKGVYFWFSLSTVVILPLVNMEELWQGRQVVAASQENPLQAIQAVFKWRISTHL